MLEMATVFSDRHSLLFTESFLTITIFLPLQPLFYKISASVCSGPLQWKLKSQPQCSREPETPAPRPRKVPHCLPKLAASEIPANPSPSQGCSAWLVGEQALSLRPRQILSDPFGTNPPVEGNEKFICIHIHWMVGTATPAAVYHIHRIRPQAREKVGR